MEKDALKALGLTDEQADKVVGMSADEIKTAYVSKADFDALTATNGTLTTQLADRDKDIGELKKNAGGDETLAKTITDLQAKYKTDTDTLKETIQKNALNSALDLGITKAHGKNATAIKALIDPGALTLKEDGSVDVSSVDAAIGTVQKSDAYLFGIEETHNSGTGNQGGSNGSGNGGAQEPQNLSEAVSQFYTAQNNQ